MADFFIYNNDGILPEYIPGIPGYGQIGSIGDTGDNGSSVYYSSFDLSDVNDLKLANECILSNNMLSNNLDSSNYNTYKENDIIIDCTGGMYLLSLDSSNKLIIKPFNTITSSIYNADSEKFIGLDVYSSTVFLNNSRYSWKPSSEYTKAYMAKVTKDDDTEEYTYTETPHKVRYRNLLEDEVYGNYITFKLLTSDEISDEYTYTYVLCFPNGQSFKSMSVNRKCTIFIDNRYIFGMFDAKSWMNPYKLKDTSLYGIINLTSDETEKNLFDSIAFNGVNKIYAKDVSDESVDTMKDSSMNNEWKKEISGMCSEFIKNNCTAHVDIFNSKTNKMYRIDFNDIFINNSIDENGDIITEQTQNTNIESAKNNIIWTNYTYPYHAWLSNTNNTYDMDGFVSFIKDDPNTIDEYKVECYFVNNRDTMDVSNRSALESYINPTVYNNLFGDFENWDNWQWNDSSAGNRVIRIYFKNLSSFSLSIKYANKVWDVSTGEEKTGSSTYPTTLVYVGAPDCNLIQYGKDSEYNSIIENIAATNTITQTTGIIPDCDFPGIYYLSKFVAPGVDTSEMQGNVMEAGLSDYTINCSTFNLSTSSYHFIEIGFVTFKDSDKEYHANIPATTVGIDQSVPLMELFTDPTDHQSEILPFSSPELDEYGLPISGAIDLSLNLSAIVDSDDSDSDASKTGETNEYNPINFVYKDTI
jgi:hypothetical protein